MNIDTINFDQDNAQRRASQNGAGVAYDPDSLLTGAEVAAGLDYENSTRVPVDRNTFSSDIDLAIHADAVAGTVSTPQVLIHLPRKLKPGAELSEDASPEARFIAAAGRWNWFEGEGE